MRMFIFLICAVALFVSLFFMDGSKEIISPFATYYITMGLLVFLIINDRLRNPQVYIKKEK